jgi:Putative prokaryotic signal transducing protein
MPVHDGDKPIATKAALREPELRVSQGKPSYATMGGEVETVSDAKLVEVASFLNKLDAELALGALKNGGIDAMVAGDDAGGEEPGLWMGGVKVMVRAADAERAKKILKKGR